MYILKKKRTSCHSPRKRLQLEPSRRMSTRVVRRTYFADSEDDVESSLGCWGKSRNSKKNGDICSTSVDSSMKETRMNYRSSERVTPILTSEVEAISEQQNKTCLHHSPRKQLRPSRRMSACLRMRAYFLSSDEDDAESSQEFWGKRRKGKRNSDICSLSVDSSAKETRLDHESERRLPALTSEMEATIDNALAVKSASKVLCEGFNISLTLVDLKVLHGEEWLSDQIISFYLSLIVERGKRRRFPSVFAFSTFFFTRLHSGRYKAVQRWTRKVDLFSFDIILIPVHKKKGHWCLSIVDFRSKRILYYDPMKRTNYNCLYALRDYLKDESLDKKNTAFDTSSWKYQNVKEVPTQESDNDCGVFILKYAEYYCRDVDIDFTQDDVQYFRRCMVYELLAKKLL